MSIFIDPIAKSLPVYLKNHAFSKLALLVDENTIKYCYPEIAQQLPDHEIIQIPSGEVHKNLETCQRIWEKLTEAAFDRKSLLINLGGGVIGDMGGFCAVTYKRGIKFINIPTTLLAAVDASIGGKLGIDFHGLKNHLGSFQEPDTVLIDPGFLQTLPDRELRSGFAEVLKHGLIADEAYFHHVRKEGINPPDWNAVIARSIHIKNAIVEADPREKGLRKVLNFGHTIGHAVESFYLNSSRPLTHGEAVAVGMVCEAYLSGKLSGLDEKELHMICETIFHIYDKVKIDQEDLIALLHLMHQDKKNSNNRLNLTLLTGIGNSSYDVAVDENDVLDALSFYINLTP